MPTLIMSLFCITLSRDLHFITSLQKAKIQFICCDMPEATPLTINLMGTLANGKGSKYQAGQNKLFFNSKNRAKN